MVTKQERRNKIKTRIRGKVSGTAERPRMTVFRSNKQIYVQLVDDSEGKTLASASSKGIEEGTKTEVAAKVGQAIAEKALAAGITEVVFDRNGYSSSIKRRSQLRQPDSSPLHGRRCC